MDLSNVMEGIVSTLIAAPILAWATPFLKGRGRQLLHLSLSVLRYTMLFLLLASILLLNAEHPDETELLSVLLILVMVLLFEACLRWQAIHQHSRVYLRALFIIPTIYACLHLTATNFDITETITVVELLILFLIFELVGPRGRIEEKDGIRYEVNRKVDRGKMKDLLAQDGRPSVTVSKVIARSDFHVAAYLGTELVSFVNLDWLGEGPAEIGDFSMYKQQFGAALGSLEQLEVEAKSAGIDEIQIPNKVAKVNAKLDSKLAEVGYRQEACWIKQLGVDVDREGSGIG